VRRPPSSQPSNARTCAATRRSRSATVGSPEPPFAAPLGPGDPALGARDLVGESVEAAPGFSAKLTHPSLQVEIAKIIVARSRQSDYGELTVQREAANEAGAKRYSLKSLPGGVWRDATELATPRVEYPESSLMQPRRVWHRESIAHDRVATDVHDGAAAGELGRATLRSARRPADCPRCCCCGRCQPASPIVSRGPRGRVIAVTSSRICNASTGRALAVSCVALPIALRDQACLFSLNEIPCPRIRSWIGIHTGVDELRDLSGVDARRSVSDGNHHSPDGARVQVARQSHGQRWWCVRCLRIQRVTDRVRRQRLAQSSCWHRRNPCRVLDTDDGRTRGNDNQRDGDR